MSRHAWRERGDTSSPSSSSILMSSHSTMTYVHFMTLWPLSCDRATGFASRVETKGTSPLLSVNQFIAVFVVMPVGGLGAEFTTPREPSASHATIARGPGFAGRILQSPPEAKAQLPRRRRQTIAFQDGISFC